MSTQASLESLREFEIPGHVTLAQGNGGLTKMNVVAKHGTAEVYLHGAHITGFQKNGEPPLLFLSRRSRFAANEAIRGGVPICFPWFGRRDGDVAHGFARVAEWNLTNTSAAADGKVTLNFRLPTPPERAAWGRLRAEFVVTVSDKLTMELIVANDSTGEAINIENCLHTYFAVGDIGAVKIRGLKGARFLDKTDRDAEKLETHEALPIVAETNRIYHDTPGPMEIVDTQFRRVIRIEKSGSADTVVWNPWTTQIMPDFDPEEHSGMICVESGNVARNKIALAPGRASTVRVELSTAPLQ
jgi:glucose-6-phosphate 1-epimerase